MRQSKTHSYGTWSLTAPTCYPLGSAETTSQANPGVLCSFLTAAHHHTVHPPPLVNAHLEHPSNCLENGPLRLKGSYTRPHLTPT